MVLVRLTEPPPFIRAGTGATANIAGEGADAMAPYVVRFAQPATSLYLSRTAAEGVGELFVADSALLWWSDETKHGYAIDYKSIVLHAIAQGDAASGIAAAHIYCQLDYGPSALAAAPAPALPLTRAAARDTLRRPVRQRRRARRAGRQHGATAVQQRARGVHRARGRGCRCAAAGARLHAQ